MKLFKIGDTIILDPPDQGACPDDPECILPPGSGVHFYNRGSIGTIVDININDDLLIVSFRGTPVDTHEDFDPKRYLLDIIDCRPGPVQKPPEPPAKFDGLEDLIL